MDLSEEKRYANVTVWQEKLNGVIGQEAAKKLIDTYGIDNFKDASYGMYSNAGTAFKGSMIYISMFQICKLAVFINSRLKCQVPIEKIVKVVLLMHIGKAILYEPETNKYMLDKGNIYKFVNDHQFISCGKRSLVMCMNCGITFDNEEIEAMECLDVAEENVYKLSLLAMIIRFATGIVNKDYETSYWMATNSNK